MRCGFQSFNNFFGVEHIEEKEKLLENRCSCRVIEKLTTFNQRMHTYSQRIRSIKYGIVVKV